jgi:hypothetical protein
MFNFPQLPWESAFNAYGRLWLKIWPAIPKEQQEQAKTVEAMVKKIQYGKAFRDW